MTTALTFRSESCDYYTIIVESKEDLESELEKFSKFEDVEMLDVVSLVGEDVTVQDFNEIASRYCDEGI